VGVCRVKMGVSGAGALQQPSRGWRRNGRGAYKSPNIHAVVIQPQSDNIASMADENNISLADGKPVELLWPQGAPGALGEAPADKPTLTIFLPPREKAVKAGVVILPGGGYGNCSMEKEGYRPALWFNSLGLAAFVVEYRHNNSAGTGYKHPVPLQDARRAMRIVRSRVYEFGIDADKIGLMGYSAGGHLAGCVATHCGEDIENAKDDLTGVAGTRPDFLMLIYPVVTMVKEYTHAGSRKALLGEYPTARMMDEWSNEKKVTDQTPPTFLVATSEDKSVPAENSIEFYLALRKWRVEAELHIYEKGPHGFGMNPGVGAASSWPDRLADWLKARGLI
jgi:acetyl esterase/lipase